MDAKYALQNIAIGIAALFVTTLAFDENVKAFVLFLLAMFFAGYYEDFLKVGIKVNRSYFIDCSIDLLARISGGAIFYIIFLVP